MTARARAPTLRRAALLTTALLLGPAAPAPAERLPVRTFSAADGLGSSFVTDITQDAAGRLWFATRDGLSWWNGYEFTTLAESRGFASAAIERVRQTRAGDYFVIDNDGALYVYRPASEHANGTTGAITFRRVSVPAPGREVRFSRLYEDRNGVLWGGGHGVLVRDPGAAPTPLPLTHPLLPDAVPIVAAMQDDPHGGLWVGTSWGLFRLRPDGTTVHYAIAPRARGDAVDALALDARGRLWIGHNLAGLFVLDPTRARENGASGQLAISPVLGQTFDLTPPAGTALRLRTANGLPDDRVASLLAASDGQVWVGTRTGLARFDGTSFTGYTTQHGLCHNLVQALFEDGDGHLWAGTPSGVTRVARDGFAGYTAEEGLATDHVVSFGEMPDGTVFAVGIDWSVSFFDGRRFRPTRLPLPEGSSLMWASQAGYRDHQGRWWGLANEGLYRFDWTAGTASPAFSPSRTFTSRDGLPSEAVFRIYEDRAGALWVATRAGNPQGDGLARFDATSSTATRVGEANGVREHSAASAFAEDTHGALWVGFYDGDLARCRDGRCRLFTAADGVPRGMVTSLVVDREGRLWIATNTGGIGVVADPAGDPPVVRHYTTRDGLRSNNVRALAEGPEGLIFAGTVRGVDRLDPVTGRVRHYGAEDGLPTGFLTTAFRDSHGALWFGTYGGAFRLTPAPDREAAPPPIAITGLRVAGRRHAVAELGQPRLSGVELQPDERDLTVEFVSVTRRHADGLRYQYSLDAASGAWSEPTSARSVNFARLPPGAYTFAVRALAPDGTTSPVPATVAFTIRPPLWQRWWALLLAVLAACATGAALYRYRVRHLLETERLRLAIASDLHDEVATNLSSIAMFSTLVRDDLPAAPPLLDRITVLATQSAAAIREIIWSIDPKPETVASLVMRLRDAMVTACHARGIDLTVSIHGQEADRNLTPEQRKNLWLILKEAVTNAVKHSGGTELRVSVAPEGRRLRIVVRDNGAGCAVPPSSGRGMETMIARAKALNGTATFLSAPGEGTTVEFLVRLAC